MNAQKLIQETKVSNFDYSVFFKSNHSQQNKCMANDKKPSTKSSSGSHKLNLQQREEESADNSKSPIKLQSEITRGDKFVARKGNNQYPQDVSEGSNTFYPSESNTSLKPQTFNYTKLNNAKRNLEWQQAEKELGLIQL